jgi:Tfp pilus assembly protein PilF/uncharacterized membrane protein
VKSTHKRSKGGKGPRPVQVSAIANGTKLAPARWLVPVIVALLIGVAFLPALQNGFVDFDDKVNFLSNPHYRGLGLDELRWMFTPFWGHYTPLTWLTLGLDYLLWGMDPAGYHLTNVLLHVATAVAFYFLTIQLLRLATGSGGEDKALWAGAAFAALFFAVHPLRVESVAWITERRDVLSGLFYVLTIFAYLRAVDRVGHGARWYWGSVVLFACALLSKSMAISLPVVLLILDVYPLRRLGGPVGWWSASARRIYTEKIPFVLLAGVASAVALVALSHFLVTSSSIDWVSPLDRLSISGYGLGFYLWKTVAPLNLSPLYELPIKINPWSPTFIWNYIIVLIFLVLTFTLRQRLPGLLAAWLAYVVILLPVIGIVQNGVHIAADRYTYLACLGWAIMAGAGIFYCWQPLVRRRIGPRTFVFTNGVAAVVVVGLGGLAWNQAQVWHDTDRLWKHVLSAAGESKIAHNNLGNAMFKRGKLGEAIKHYRQALRVDPAYVRTHNNLGNAMLKQGELGEAIKYYRQALQIDPASEDAHNNLGSAMLKRGELGEAIKHYREALRINPASENAHNNLGRAMVKRGKLGEAIKHYREALRINPAYAQAHNDLGVALLREGKLKEATEHFCQALRLGYALAEKNLKVALARLGKREDTIRSCRETQSNM